MMPSNIRLLALPCLLAITAAPAAAADMIEGVVTIPVITGRAERQPFTGRPGWVTVFPAGESKGVSGRVGKDGRFKLPAPEAPVTLVAMFDRMETPPVIIPKWPIEPDNYDVPITPEYCCAPPGYPEVWKEKYMLRAHNFYQTFVATCSQLYQVSVWDGPKIIWWGNKVNMSILEGGHQGPRIMMNAWAGEGQEDHTSASHSDFELPRGGWRHGDMPVIPGRKYAVRVGGYNSHGGEHFNLDAFVRPDNGDGYGPGQAYQEKVATGGDLCMMLFGNGNGQILENNLRCEEWEIFIPKREPTRNWGQTFRASGVSLAGLTFWASNGSDRQVSCTVRVRENDARGRQIGPAKTCASMDVPDRPKIRYPDYPGELPDHGAFYKLPSDFFQIGFKPDEVPLEKGRTYYIEVEAGEPVMFYADGDFYTRGYAYHNGEKIGDNLPKGSTFHSGRYTLLMNIVLYENPKGAPNTYPPAAGTPAARKGDNLLLNGDAETGDFSHWQIGSDPVIDPSTDIPDPPNHGGEHRFGISVGWNRADMYQYQEVQGLTAGDEYQAGMWATHADGTHESAELLWIDGAFGGRENLLARTPPEAVRQWTLYEGKPFKPTGSTVTIVIRYRHTEPSNIASIHVDDVYLKPIKPGG